MTTQTLASPTTASYRETSHKTQGDGFFEALCGVQGVYYLATGIWPLVSMRTFEQVTGRKTDNWTGREGDHWLVKTVGVLVTAVGAALLTAGRRRENVAAVPVLAAGSALGLAAIDCVYVARGVIAPIYLADAVAEVGLAAAWAWQASREQTRQTTSGQ